MTYRKVTSFSIGRKPGSTTLCDRLIFVDVIKFPMRKRHHTIWRQTVPKGQNQVSAFHRCPYYRGRGNLFWITVQPPPAAFWSQKTSKAPEPSGSIVYTPLFLWPDLYSSAQFFLTIIIILRNYIIFISPWKKGKPYNQGIWQRVFCFKPDISV